jgi:hypothetical protein
MKMKTSRIVWLVVTAVITVWVAMNFSNESPFHAPVTDAEKALDATLQTVGNDKYMFANAHIHPMPVPNGKHVDYSPLLTAKLIARITADEKRMVSETCNDVYVEGEVCGFDYDPILCAQDVNPTYVYKTLQADASRASIDYSWPMEGSRRETTSAHYGMVKDGGRWKIDTVSCVFD